MIDVCRLCVSGHRPELPMPGPGFHYECGLRMVLGGIGHLTDHDYWCVENGDPDMGLTFRESAMGVAAWVKTHGIEAATGVKT